MVLDVEVFRVEPSGHVLITRHCSRRLVAHLGSQRVRADGDEFEARRATTMGALRSNGFVVEHLVLIRFQPHELEALWARSDLR